MKTVLTVISDGRYVEAVVGYRIWQAFGDHGCMFLNSVWSPAMWDDETAELNAECSCGPKISLDLGERDLDRFMNVKVISINGEPFQHRCGVHAWDRPSLVPPYTSRMNAAVIAGEVRLWGDVHVHERGYRAEHARIAALFTDPNDPVRKKRIELAALTYNVPLVTLSAEEVK